MRSIALIFLATILTAQSVPEVEITAEPNHHLVLTNDQVRVFNVDIAAHTATLMHWHRHDYVYITLGDTEIVNEVEGKAPVNGKMQDGDAGFAHGNFAHLVRASSDHPFRNVTIEILQDAKLRNQPAPALESRGLEILKGGTKEILFVKDGIRVSEFEIQQGLGEAIISPGPYLLIALTDVELMQTEHNAPVSFGSTYIHLKPGEARWIPTPHRSTLIHRGPPVKFITLEFPKE
jgi:hypothetical protein